jgi:hypothetical protein
MRNLDFLLAHLESIRLPQLLEVAVNLETQGGEANVVAAEILREVVRMAEAERLAVKNG